MTFWGLIDWAWIIAGTTGTLALALFPLTVEWLCSDSRKSGE